MYFASVEIYICVCFLRELNFICSSILILCGIVFSDQLSRKQITLPAYTEKIVQGWRVGRANFWSISLQNTANCLYDTFKVVSGYPASGDNFCFK